MARRKTSLAEDVVDLVALLPWWGTAKKGANAGSQFWGCPEYPACHATRP